METLFLDASVFLYALGGASPHRESCRQLLQAVGEGHLDSVTNAEVLQELLHVRLRRLALEDAVEAVRDAAVLVGEVLPVTPGDVLVACDLLQQHPRLGGRNALHVAVMANAGISTLVSLDHDFDTLRGLTRLDPEDALKRAG